ncbi:hypothetical protein ACS0TY_019529 [Phlomoides rotata]
MSARALILTLTRNARRAKKIPFRSISSSTEAVKQEPITGTHEGRSDELTEKEEENDDLKSRIFRLRLPKRSVTSVLQKWANEGRLITLSDLRRISKDLRKSHRYKHALEISEWMVSHDEYKLSESDYAVRIDLMTQVFGIDAAERYFEGLPSSAKTSEAYTALLHCYARSKLIEKAEDLYERLKGTYLSLDAITYNELMTLYMSVGQLGKVSLIVEDMKRQNVAPDLFTYNLWISSYAAALNMDEDTLDQIWKSLRTTRQKMTGRNYICVLSSYLMMGHLKEVGDIIDQWKQCATSEFNGNLCNKVLVAFKEIGMADKATSFQMVLGEKG